MSYPVIEQLYIDERRCTARRGSSVDYHADGHKPSNAAHLRHNQNADAKKGHAVIDNRRVGISRKGVTPMTCPSVRQ